MKSLAKIQFKHCSYSLLSEATGTSEIHKKKNPLFVLILLDSSIYSEKKQVGGCNHRVVTLVAYWLERLWLCLTNCSK